MRARILGAALAFSTVGLAISSCSDPQSIGRGFDLDGSASPSPFLGSDAGEGDAEGGLISYCPSNRCPVGFTTCPTSRFTCDVNLLTDRDNCGECGHNCPEGAGSGGATYECSEGRCVMACGSPPDNIDCDDAPDNGCETVSTTNENCGACGVECRDPAKPCVRRTTGLLGCGCDAGDLYCVDPDTGLGRCIDGKADDRNCGACGNVCNPDGPGGERPPNSYYGCIDSKCDRIKCESPFLNCDDDPLNGCEAFAFSPDNCGTCGNVCGATMKCQGNRYGSPQCSCAAGQTYCPLFCIDDLCLAGQCTDLGSDRENCGACGNVCPNGDNYGIPICTSGICGWQCVKGRADCNGSPHDNCEVNTDSDPQNCGACGHVCDAIAGQACVGGLCVVEPCVEIGNDGGAAR